MKKTFFVLLFVLFPCFVYADATTSESIGANVNVRYQSNLVFSGQVVLDPSGTSTVTDNAGVARSIPSNSVLSALLAADATSTSFSISDLAYYDSYGSYIVNCIDIEASSTNACYNWQYVVNSSYPSVGVEDYFLSDGDTIYLYFGTPRRFSLSATSTHATIPVSVLAESYDYEDDSWHPLAGALVGATQPNPDDSYSPLVPFSATSDDQGLAVLRIDTSGTFGVGLASDFYYPTEELVVVSTTSEDIIFRLRAGSNIAYEGVIPLPSSGTTTARDSMGEDHEISTRSVLNILMLSDAVSQSFGVTDLAYYPSYGSFYVKCVSVASTDECDNWQYSIDGETPGASADSYYVSGGEEVYFYFASPQRISLSSASVSVGTSVTATADAYRASDGSYVPIQNVILGLSKGSSILATSTTDNLGRAMFSPTATGTHEIGIYNDGVYGSYLYPTASFEVTAISEPNNGGSGGGGGSSSGGTTVSVQIDSANALSFLLSKQRADGSFGASLYTDWAGVALGAVSGADSAIKSLKGYLTANQVSGSIATDYERRAMALMSLGINPYNGTNVDYISKIVGFFDGTQIGDDGLVNDDIFAIFPLMNAGYSMSDDVVDKVARFIVSRQASDGSWGSVDLTAAAVQALKLVDSIPNVSSAISKARDYLKSAQSNDGGFGNVSSTSWTAQAIAALGESDASWSKNGKTPVSMLSDSQSSDGGWGSGEGDDSRAWQTAYALVGAAGLTWDSVMTNFHKPPQAVNSGTNSPSSVSVETLEAEEVLVAEPTEISIRLDVSIDDFVKRYIAALAIVSSPQKAVSARPLGPQGFDLSLLTKKSRGASVIGVTLVSTSTPSVKKWFAPLLKVFGL